VAAADAGENALPTERPYFLYAGRLERLKGVDTLIDAFRQYTAADLVIAGAGSEGASLRRRAAGLSHIRFVGHVDASHLASLYRSAIAALVPTVGYEVFPFVTIEALAHGTPAIVRDFGGLSEAIEDSGAGFVYSNDAELCQAMDALRTDAALRAELGERGTRAVAELWSEDVHLKNYLAIAGEASSTRSPVSAER
jgi:glycosyltransferase involved in cell wall biosynthesis